MLEEKIRTQYLKEMGLQEWSLLHPTRLTGYHLPSIDLPASCLLLLVSPAYPEGDSVIMFEKILKSIGLTIHQAMHIFPEQVCQLNDHQLTWMWFSGCENPFSEKESERNITEAEIKTLTSPLLADIDGNNQVRRHLWQQICSYNT